MQWFEGSIPDAIAESKRRKVVFIVCVEGQNEDTGKMNSTLSDPKVGKTCSQDVCVAIRMNVKSEQCQQFAQLYPVVCVPVIYFIGDAGLPLEVVGGAVSVDEFVSKATAAFETFEKSTQDGPVLNSTQDSPVANTSAGETSVSQEVSSASDPSLDERVQRAKQLIEENRKEKAAKEKEEQRKQESERRRQGQELVEAKQELEARKAQILQQKIKEDKARERAHLEAVRQQIARDKAEREARKLTELQERAASDASSPASSSNSKAPERSVNSQCTNTRLQFRFPDGSVVTNTFPADCLLEAARQFIVSHSFASGYSSGVTLFMTYPRREMTDEDLLKTLRDLSLTPSSTLIVMPKKQENRSIRPAGGSSVSDLLLWIISPLFALINFIKTFLFASSDQSGGTGGNTSTNRHANKSWTDKSTNSSGVRRRDGGIHRLRETEDDDDDNNTWNGNSTQQM